MPDECRVYEHLARSGTAGDTIRPGGLKLTQRAIELCAFPPEARLLDIGCGPGATVEYLIERHGFRAAGIDPSAAMIECGLKRNENLPLIAASGESLPFGAESWEGILAECSLSLARDLDRVLDECRRMLTAGGRLIVTDMYTRSPGGTEASVVPSSCCLSGAISKEGWIGKIEEHGFRVTLFEDHTMALKEFAAMLIFSHGSLDMFWQKAAGRQPREAARIGQATSGMKPGYFLMIAEKSHA